MMPDIVPSASTLLAITLDDLCQETKEDEDDNGNDVDNDHDDDDDVQVDETLPHLPCHGQTLFHSIHLENHLLDKKPSVDHHY